MTSPPTTSSHTQHRPSPQWGPTPHIRETPLPQWWWSPFVQPVDHPPPSGVRPLCDMCARGHSLCEGECAPCAEMSLGLVRSEDCRWCECESRPCVRGDLLSVCGRPFGYYIEPSHSTRERRNKNLYSFQPLYNTTGPTYINLSVVYPPPLK